MSRRFQGLPESAGLLLALTCSTFPCHAQCTQIGWSALPGPVDGNGDYIQALAGFDHGNGKALYVGGNFTAIAGAPLSRIATWDGRNWSPLGTGVNGLVRVLQVYDDGTGP